MEKIIFELTIGEIIVYGLLLFALTFTINMACNLEFREVPFIRRWITGRGNLYRTGFNDGLEHKIIKEYNLKRDRKIRKIENKMYRAQKRYDEFYLNVQKYQFLKEINESC